MRAQARNTQAFSSPARRWIGMSLVAAGLVGAVPAPASAQLIEIMEWIDKLSGPGPFRSTSIVPSVSIPLACVTHVFIRDISEAEFRAKVRSIKRPLNQRELPASFADEMRSLDSAERFQIEAAPGCLGLVGASRGFNHDPAPWGATKDDKVIFRKRNILGVELKFSHLSSSDNDLEGYPRNLDEDRKQVNIFVYGFGFRYLPYEFAFVELAWQAHKFYSSEGLFESFTRNAESIDVGFKPLYFGVPRWLQPFTVSVGVRHGLGTFTAADFGARGAFVADDDWKFNYNFGYDIWWHGCIMPGLCNR